MDEIARIETFLVPPRWLFVRIETDRGVVGWGEPVVGGSAGIVRAAFAQHCEYLLGEDATHIGDHWQVMTRGGTARSARSRSRSRSPCGRLRDPRPADPGAQHRHPLQRGIRRVRPLLNASLFDFVPGYVERWRSPVWRHPDGSFAEW